jgi:hypothetical protein
MFDDEQLNTIQAHPDVALVTEDGIASIRDTVVQYVLVRLRRRNANSVSRTDAFWGTARLSQDQGLAIQTSEEAPDYDYYYDESSGNGVDIYILGEFHEYFILCSSAQGLSRYWRIHRSCTSFLHLVPIYCCLAMN